jgi:hypothetical protein
VADFDAKQLADAGSVSWLEEHYMAYAMYLYEDILQAGPCFEITQWVDFTASRALSGFAFIGAS